ncbi:MAG: hypothetical protein KDK99_19025, partial [Verrucomicrobiales bacterium]|nr:hypothetical protein [Verrucomicrobiales bacterium]
QGDTQWVYPILDPSALETFGTESRVQGVQILSAVPGTYANQPVPMPAQWLYVLSDGSVAAPQSVLNGGTSIRLDSSLFPTGAKTRDATHIVGRIAFWTDDESCKINLNTAGEPVPWTPPHTASQRDVWAADSQPARREWHRQPGHPAYTAASPVLRSFGETSPASLLQPQPEPLSDTDNFRQSFKDYISATLDLLPLELGRDTGSAHGTALLDDTSAPIRPVRRRLLHHLDELLFDDGSNSADGRATNGSQTVGGYSVTERDVRRARFFATTHSSAPETNPFNQPKISLWPVQANASERNAFDQKMRLAASIGGPISNRRHYGITRSASWSSRASPGSALSDVADLANHADNTALFHWLRSQSNGSAGFGPIPGFGGTFEGKYGLENTESLVLSFFDLLRWQRNSSQHDSDLPPAFDFLPPAWAGGSSTPGAGMVAPLKWANPSGAFPGITASPSNLRGPGRVPIVREAALVFAAVDAQQANGSIKNENDPDFADVTTKVRCFLVLEFFNPSPSGTSWTPDLEVTLAGINGGVKAERFLDGPVVVQELIIPLTVDGTTGNFGSTGVGVAGDPKLLNNLTFEPSLPPAGGLLPWGGNRSAWTGLAAP